MSNNTKIRVQYEYISDIRVIEIESYKPISALYEKAQSLFHPLNFYQDNKILTFNTKDIFDKSIVPIGEVFRNKTKVTLKIISVNTKSTKQNLSPIKKISKEYYNPEDDVLVSRKIKVESNNNSNSNDTNSSIKKINSLNCTCKCNEQINFYCRKCKEFLCKNCRYKSDHINHKTIVIDIQKPSYLESSLALYCMNIQADISICNKALEGYSNLFKNIDLFNFKDSKSKIMKKIQNFEDKIQNLTKTLPKVESCDKLSNELDEANKKVNSEVAVILNDLEKIKNNNFNKSLFETIPKNSTIKSNDNKLENAKTISKTDKDIFDLLEQVSNLEVEVENLSQRSLAMKLNYDVHRKIDEMYNNIIVSFDSNVFSETYDFNLDFDAKECKFVPTEITTILRQTANSKGNMISTSIQNLINLGKTLKKEMDEERKEDLAIKNIDKVEKDKEKEKSSTTVKKEAKKEINSK